MGCSDSLGHWHASKEEDSAGPLIITARREFTFTSLLLRNFTVLLLLQHHLLLLLPGPWAAVFVSYLYASQGTMLSFHAIWFYRSRLELFTRGETRMEILSWWVLFLLLLLLEFSGLIVEEVALLLI